MNDPEPQRNNNGADDEERRREEEMERMLLEQEEEDERQLQEGLDQNEEDMNPLIVQEQRQVEVPNPKKFRISYLQASFIAAVGLIWYALRTRQQWYLALVFLGSSKWAYIILGNAIVAFCVMLFRSISNFFLGGLRLLESERLGDFFRWNITETCLALTMFRHELTVTSCVFFLFLVLCKCLHWVAELREGHLRMTQETFVLRTSGIFTFVPKIHPAHRGVISMIHLLVCIDIIVVVYCIQEIVTNGKSVIILFGFEAGIMTVSAISSLFLWHMHAIDSLLQYLHDETSVNANAILHAWKDRKATITFAIEVQAQGAKFLLYCTFFAIVYTHYGLPINLFRELYMSFQALKQRVLAFAKYRRLMSNMNRFSNVSSEQELEETGKTCIICRDEMTIRDCKKLPGCGHCFHKSCLREWLVQQQTCPTCRGDITANAERERKQKREEAQAEAERNAARNDDDDDDDEEEEIGRKESTQSPPEETKDNNSTSPVQPSQTTGLARSPQPTLIKIQSRSSTLRLSKKQSIESKSESKKAKAKASSLLPAFYLVTSEEGATVHNLETGETVRVVSKGIALFCTKLDLQNFRDEPGLMLKIPDGWVMESDVEFVSSVGLYT